MTRYNTHMPCLFSNAAACVRMYECVGVRCVDFLFSPFLYFRDMAPLCCDYGFDPTLLDKNPDGTRTRKHDTKRVENANIDYYSMGLSGHGKWIVNSGKAIPTMTLHGVMRMFGHDRINILKVDVEGVEGGRISHHLHLQCNPCADWDRETRSTHAPFCPTRLFSFVCLLLNALPSPNSGSEWGMILRQKDWNDSPLDRADQLLMEMHLEHVPFFVLYDTLQVRTNY